MFPCRSNTHALHSSRTKALQFARALFVCSLRAALGRRAFVARSGTLIDGYLKDIVDELSLLLRANQLSY